MTRNLLTMLRPVIGAAILLVLATLACVRTIPSAEAAEPAPSVIAKAMKAVVAIRGADDAVRAARGETQLASGSGFVFDARGLILTNAHVVAKTDTVEVAFADGGTMVGTVVGRDSRTDLAVIKVTGGGMLPALEFAPERLPLGGRVYALGSPMGQKFSVTSGVVSGYDRVYDISWPVDFVQHDAALNPGSSGGPLIDAAGRVIGINTATPPETLFDIGIAYAIPAKLAGRVAGELAAKGYVARGRLGVTVSGFDLAMAQSMGYPPRRGLIIDSVSDDAIAVTAGLEPGDVLFAIDGRPLLVARDLSLAIREKRPGDTIQVEYFADGETRRASIALDSDGSRDGERGRAGVLAIGGDATPESDFSLGLTFKSNGTGGLTITSVDDMSVAATFGLFQGDEVLAINGNAVDTPAAAAALLADPARDVAVLRIERLGQGVQHVVLPTKATSAARRRAGSPERFPQGPL